MSVRCLICNHQNLESISHQQRPGLFWHCLICDFAFLDPMERALPEAEKARYETHQNLSSDQGYRDFLKPIWGSLQELGQTDLKILDYGSGPTQALAEILRELGHRVDCYDPFFAPTLMGKDYDLIVSTEAIEHFYDPRKEVLKMEGLLAPNARIGEIWVMTQIFHKEKFADWWYVRDFTHVCFFSREALSRLSPKIVLKEKV
ncbi:MAG: methyltransferase domain-containing protein [Pseudobdellovibrionaceae bacterium]